MKSINKLQNKWFEAKMRLTSAIEKLKLVIGNDEQMLLDAAERVTIANERHLQTTSALFIVKDAKEHGISQLLALASSLNKLPEDLASLVAAAVREE